MAFLNKLYSEHEKAITPFPIGLSSCLDSTVALLWECVMFTVNYLWDVVCVCRLNDNRGRLTFESTLRELFVALNMLISDSRESVITVQEAVLTYLPTIIGDVMTVYDPLEFTYVLGIFWHNYLPTIISDVMIIEIMFVIGIYCHMSFSRQQRHNDRLEERTVLCCIVSHRWQQ